MGAGLLGFEDKGSAELEAVMQEVEDRLLSERAWRMLYLKQGDGFFAVTEAEDAAAHALHPWLSR